MAVMAPTGSSAGATTVRARVSAMTTAMAPPKGRPQVIRVTRPGATALNACVGR